MPECPEYHKGRAKKNGCDSKCPHQKTKEILINNLMIHLKAL